MPGGRPTQRLGITATWRFQKHLAELQAVVDATPSHESLPCLIRTAVDTAVRCINAGNGTSVDSVQQPPSPQHQQAYQAALRHLNYALEAVPVPLQRLAHSMMHAMLFLATDAVRDAATQLGFATDDLALPATWLLPIASYAWLVKQMGWEVLLLEAIVLLFTPSQKPECIPQQQQTASQNSGFCERQPAVKCTTLHAADNQQEDAASLYASAAGRVLHRILAEQPFLCHPMLDLLVPELEHPASGSSQRVPNLPLQQLLNLVITALPQASQCDFDPLIKQCSCLCLVVQQAGPRDGQGDLMTSTTAELYEQSAVKLEAGICSLSELLPLQNTSSAIAVSHRTAHSLGALVAHLKQLAVSIQLQSSQPSQTQTLASAVLRLKCRLAFSLADIEKHAASLTEAVDSKNQPAATHQPTILLSVAHSNNLHTQDLGDELLQLLRKHGCAAFDIAANQGGQSNVQLAGLLISQLLRLNIPAVSQHGLTPTALSKLRMLASSSSITQSHNTLARAVSSGISNTDLSRQHHATPFCALPPPASIVNMWEQHILGFVIATLTPGLPSPWQLLTSPDALQAAGAGTYSTFRVVLAMIELASRMESFGQSQSNEAHNMDGSTVNASGKRTQLMAPLHPLLRDCVLAVAVAGMQQITEAKQQSTLLHIVQEQQQTCRLLHVLSEAVNHIQGTRTALVLHSNQATAQQETGQNIALSRDAEAQKVAATALNALPYAVLMPKQLLQHVVEESLKNPGQLPLQFNLLAGPLRPVTLKPARHTWNAQGLATASRNTGNNDGHVSCTTEYPALVIVLQNSIQTTCQSDAMNDTSLRAALNLLSACVGVGETSTSSSVHLGSLLSITDVAAGIGLPLLGWCVEDARLDQARAVVSIVAHILSLGSNQATAHHAWQPCLAALLQVPDGQKLVLSILSLAVSLSQQLQQAAKQGHVSSSSIDKAWELLEGLVAGLQQVMLQQQGTLQPVKPLLADLLLKYAVTLEVASIVVLLPLLQACLTVLALSRVNQADINNKHTGDSLRQHDDEEEDLVSAWSSKLNRTLMPPSVWRPSTAAAAGCIPQQLMGLLRLAINHQGHAQLLISCLHEETATQLEDAIDAGADKDEEDHATIAEVLRCQAACESLAWLSSCTLDNSMSAARTMPSSQATKVGVAATCMRAMQRRLSSADAVRLANLLPEQIMDLLPSLATRQAALLLEFVIPALIASLSTEKRMSRLTQDWACSVAQQYIAEQNNDCGASLSGHLINVLQPKPSKQAVPQAGFSASQTHFLPTLPTGLLLAQGYSMHVVCQAIITIAARIARQSVDVNGSPLPTSDANGASVESKQTCSTLQLERCLQLLVAATRNLIPFEDSVAARDSLQRQLRPHHVGTGGFTVSPTKPWILAAVLLPELLGCWVSLADYSRTIGVLNVAVLHTLRIVLQPMPTCNSLSRVSDESHGITNKGLNTDDASLEIGDALQYNHIVHAVAGLLHKTSSSLKQKGRNEVASSFMEMHLAAVQLVEEYVAKQSRAHNKDISIDAVVDVNQVLGFDMEAMLLD